MIFIIYLFLVLEYFDGGFVFLFSVNVDSKGEEMKLFKLLKFLFFEGLLIYVMFIFSFMVVMFFLFVVVNFFFFCCIVV